MQIDRNNYGMMLFMSKQVSVPKISSHLQQMKIGQNSIYALFARRPSIINKSMVWPWAQNGTYANLFVGYIEHKFFNQYNGPKPELYRCYIDNCVGATSSTREELNQFTTAVNSFHPALKYTWEISNTSLALLDIKLSMEGNGLCTSVHYKPTDSHSYLLYSSSHPSHVKNSIPYSQFLRLSHLCSEDSDFSLKSEEMCHFFDKPGYLASVV